MADDARLAELRGLIAEAVPLLPVVSAWAEQHAARRAVADELARHASTMDYQYGSHPDTPVTLGCTCGHQRGTVTKRELAADLDGRMRDHRLHVADAVIAVLGGEDSRLGADALKDALRGYMLDRCPKDERATTDGNGADPTTTEGRR